MEVFDGILQVLTLNWDLVALFFLIAILYSSVGFGGGSSYLAVLSLFSLPFEQMRSIALICNIIVVCSGIFLYTKNNLYNWKKIIPLVLISVPAAYLGGKLKIEQTFFFITLGIALIIAALFMWRSKQVVDKSEKTFSSSEIKNAGTGGVIGFVSGLLGLGGGIFLAPFLHLSKWDTPKRIAAISSLFIFVNSIAGLIGQSQNEDFYLEPKLTITLALSVLIGGQIGSRLSLKFISPFQLKKGTAILIFVVGIRILWKYLFN